VDAVNDLAQSASDATAAHGAYAVAARLLRERRDSQSTAERVSDLGGAEVI
jgi:hypothetical protein